MFIRFFFTLLQVHKKLGLSPGDSTEKRADFLNKDVRRKKEKSKTKEFKVTT